MFNNTKLFCIFCFHLLCLVLSPCHANSNEIVHNFASSRPWYSLFIEESLISDSRFYTSKIENLAAEKTSNQEMTLYPEMQELVCEFPARYLELSTDPKKAQIDLLKCSEFQKFISMIQKKYISLSLTSENIQSTTTATGHLFITLHDQVQPELDAHVISFFAHQNDEDSFFAYAYNGIFGNYPGYFHLDPFFQKQYEYTELENRFIYHYQLKMSPEQKYLLYAIFYELKKAQLKYYFFNFNCSQQIDYILSSIFKTNHLPTRFFVLPIDVAKHHQRQFENVSISIPLKHQAYRSIEKLNSSEKNNLRLFLKKEKPFENLEPQTKNAAAHFLKYDFRSNQKKYSDLSEQLNQFVATDAEKTNQDIPQPLLTPRRNRLQFEAELASKSPSYEFTYRPLLIDHQDLRELFWSQSNVSILKTQLKIQNHQLKLQQFEIIQMQGLTDYSRFFSDLSWNFYSGLNRLNRNSNLLFENHFGIGQTFLIFEQITFFYSLGLGFEFDDKIQNGFGIGLQQIKWNFSKNLFLHTEISVKKYSSFTSDFTHLGLGYQFKENTYGLQIKKDANSKKASAFLSLQHYF